MLKQLRAKRAKLLDAAHAMQASATAEDRELTDDEFAEIRDAVAEAEELQTQIAALEARATVLTSLDAAHASLDRPPAARSIPAVTPAAASEAHVTSVVPAIETDPMRGFADPTAFLSAVMDFSRERSAGGSGDVTIAANPGLALLAAAGSDEQSTFSDPHGGFLVPTTMSPDIMSTPSEADPTAGRTTAVPMATPKVSINARVDKDHSTSVSGGLTVKRRAESADFAASRMTFEQVNLIAQNLTGMAFATEELLTDSPQSFAAILANGFEDEFASHRLQEKIDGNGVGEPEGINTSPALVTVAKEAGQAATTLVYENIINMRARVWGYNNAIWLANHDTLPQLMLMNQSVGTAGGQVVWQPSAREDHPDTLLGRPLFFTEYMQTLGTAGDIHCTNWSQYLTGTYQPMQSAESIHVRFVEHERAFKFWLRDDARGWWRSALTPKNSANTLSPFVTLAVRA